MAAAPKKAATLTKLVIGKVEVGIGLFSSTQKPGKLTEFTTAGPNGGVLMQDDTTAEAPLSAETPLPEERVGRTDAFSDPGSEAPLPTDEGSTQAATAAKVLTPGEFRTTLVEKGTGVRVERADVRRGVRHEDGTFVDCTEQLAQIERETKLEQMTVVGFIDVGQVERARIEGSYYVGAAEPKSLIPMRLIYEAMKLKRRVAVVKWSVRSRQSLGVMVAHGNSGTLVLLKLAWAEDWREAPAKAVSIQGAEVTAEQVDMAARLVEAMSDTVDTLDGLRDDAIELREELYEKALKGEVAPVEVPEPEPDEELEDAFAASVEALLATPRAGKG